MLKLKRLACAALAAVFTVSAMAAYHLWGPGDADVGRVPVRLFHAGNRDDGGRYGVFHRRLPGLSV